MTMHTVYTATREQPSFERVLRRMRKEHTKPVKSKRPLFDFMRLSYAGSRLG